MARDLRAQMEASGQWRKEDLTSCPELQPSISNCVSISLTQAVGGINTSLLPLSVGHESSHDCCLYELIHADVCSTNGAERVLNVQLAGQQSLSRGTAGCSLLSPEISDFVLKLS